jgi:hypothetical protein
MPVMIAILIVTMMQVSGGEKEMCTVYVYQMYEIDFFHNGELWASFTYVYYLRRRVMYFTLSNNY